MLDAEHQMRTTLTLDDDVLAAARVLARQRKQPIGSVISALAREALGSAQKANTQLGRVCKAVTALMPNGRGAPW
jgi:hypothetical protein